MKRKIIIGLGLLAAIIFYFWKWGLPVTESDLVGTYVFPNPDKPFLPELPTQKDTLIFYSDNTFSSNYYGNGTFETDFGLFARDLKIKYEYEFGKASLKTELIKTLGKSPRIILNNDLNKYYEKIK